MLTHFKPTNVAALIVIAIVSIALHANGQSFEVRLVHPNNDMIVSSKASDMDLRGYEKFIWKGKKENEELWVSKKAEIDTYDLKRAQISFGPRNDPQVIILLTDRGGKKLAEFTGANVRRRTATLLDGQILKTSVISMQVTGGKIGIVGDFKIAEIKSIADRINELIAKAGDADR